MKCQFKKKWTKFFTYKNKINLFILFFKKLYRTCNCFRFFVFFLTQLKLLNQNNTLPV